MKKFSTLTAIFAMLFSASMVAQNFPGDPGTLVVDLETVAVDQTGDFIPGQAPTGAGAYSLGDTVMVTARTIPGYTFTSWDNQSTDNPLQVIMDATKSVTAFYNHDLYTVTFLNADSTALSSAQYYYGDPLPSIQDPTLQATTQYTFVFAGWSPERDSIVKGETTYIALYDTIVNRYVVKFFDYDETVLKTDTLDYGTMPTAPTGMNRPTEQGIAYTFSGWEPELHAVEGDENYTATYEETELQYSIIVICGTDTTIQQSVTYGTEVTIYPTEPAEQHFTQWSDGNTDLQRMVTVTQDTAVIALFADSYIDIPVAANAWTFFCLPEIMIGDGWQTEMLITDSLANVAWGTYSGELRASAQSGWMTPKEFYAKQGYIIYSTKAGMLRMNAYPEMVATKAVNVMLQEFESAHAENANWNFIGNPYNVAIEASAIIAPDTVELSATMWNGTGYDNELLSSASLAFQPMQAFFIQTPGEFMITFDKNANPAPARQAPAQVEENSRVDIEATAGGYTDKSRIIFRSNSSVKYEAGRDASKFMTSTAPIQMYLIDVDNIECAQMVCPASEDNIRLGYMLREAGEINIEMPVYANDYELYDTRSGRTYDLYEKVTIYSEAGTYNNRLELRPVKKVVTAIDNSTVGSTTKLFINGQLYLIRDGKTYSVQGIEAK